MGKFYIAYTNDIMTPTDNVVHYANQPDLYLKSYSPENNVLWDGAERKRRYEEFAQYNRGLIGKGEVILKENEDSTTLTEFYSGVEVTPIQAVHYENRGSNIGDAAYYIAQIEDPCKLYIPLSDIREISEQESLDFLNNNTRDIENEVVIPLTNRQNIVEKNMELLNNSKITK